MAVRFGITLSAITIATALVYMPSASAQESFVAPRAVAQPAPPLTTNAIGIPTEGWAVVRYTVLTDGTTSRIDVIDIVPPSADPTATIEAIEQWTFTPGTKDGDAIDWHNNESIVVFQSPADDAGSTMFEEAYAEIVDIIQAQVPTSEGPETEQAIAAFERAREANLKLLNEHATRVEDIALALSQAGLINIYLKNSHEAYDFSRRATDPRNPLLEGQDLRVALQQRFQLEATLGRTRDALRTYERIAAGYASDESNPTSELAGLLRTRARDQEILQAMGFVGEQPWRIDASRKIFTLNDIEGRVTSIDAECDSARIRLDYQPDVEWRLPDSLGDCTYFVNAEPGTSFSFYELLPP
jgi:hypothetical protein